MNTQIINNRVGQHIFRVDPLLWAKITNLAGSTYYEKVGEYLAAMSPSAYAAILPFVTDEATA